MTEVRPLSKALNPQLLPGRCSVGCPLFQVCVHLDGLNAENTFHYRVILCITVYETNKADLSLILYLFCIYFTKCKYHPHPGLYKKCDIEVQLYHHTYTSACSVRLRKKRKSPTSKKICDIKFTSSPTNGMRGTIWLLLSTKLTLLANQMFLFL